MDPTTQRFTVCRHLFCLAYNVSIKLLDTIAGEFKNGKVQHASEFKDSSAVRNTNDQQMTYYDIQHINKRYELKLTSKSFYNDIYSIKFHNDICSIIYNYQYFNSKSSSGGNNA